MASTQALKPLSVHIISDSICPFCYLGYKQITRAIESAKKEGLPLAFSLRFKPFLLDPTLPMDTPVNKRDRYVKKFGAARVDGMEKAMIARGKTMGINFSYAGMVRQTTDSHRLIEKAYAIGGEPMQRAVVEALFAGYFEHERDVGSIEFLSECAVKAGVFDGEAAAGEFFVGTEMKDDVKKGIEDAFQMGVSGVPFVILNNKYAVSGAQGEETFLDIFRKIAAGTKLAVEAEDGETC